MSTQRVAPQIRGPLGAFQLIDPDTAVLITVIGAVIVGMVFG